MLSDFKGGTGKTTTAVNLAHGLAKKDYKVLLVDLDGQGNLTDLLGIADKVNPQTCISKTIKGGDLTIYAINDKLDAIGVCTQSMIGIEFYINNIGKGNNDVLRNILSGVKDDYDFILLDCAPALNIMSVNAFQISDRIMVPIVSDYLSLTGFYKLEPMIYEYTSRTITDIFITKHEPLTKLGKNVVEHLKANRGRLLFNTKIPKNIAIAEQGVEKKSIYDHAKGSLGAAAYERFTNEFLNRVK